MKKILAALQDLPSNQHSQSICEIGLDWLCQLAGRAIRAPRIFFILSAWLCIINGMSKTTAYVLQFFSLISDSLGSVSAYTNPGLYKPEYIGIESNVKFCFFEGADCKSCLFDDIFCRFFNVLFLATCNGVGQRFNNFLGLLLFQLGFV